MESFVKNWFFFVGQLKHFEFQSQNDMDVMSAIAIKYIFSYQWKINLRLPNAHRVHNVDPFNTLRLIMFDVRRYQRIVTVTVYCYELRVINEI